MGEEIEYSRFNKSDYHRFFNELEKETRLLESWFNDDRFSKAHLTAGYELEAWLIDRHGQPAPDNERFLKQANNVLLSPELARFNIELNVDPQPLADQTLSGFDHELNKLWSQCHEIADSLDEDIISIGILPTLKDSDLTLDNISQLDRYRALNEQVLRHRKGQEIRLNINGTEHLEVTHKDVMLEAASTSLQIHLQVPQRDIARYYNASIILSAPMVSVSANAPCLFGHRLWQETRIPVFEQSVATGGFGDASSGPVQRVSFGSGYVRKSIFECFRENLDHFPVLLPVDYRETSEKLRHLRLHNGTIWRWNRPLIGFDDDGTPHIRIEHRVCSAAPSLADNIANIAFYYGLVHYYATRETPPEEILPFAQVKNDFYRCAQIGLKNKLKWLEGNNTTMQKIILDTLLIAAETGLYQLGINHDDAQHYLGIIQNRVISGQTGSQWQLDFLNAHQGDQQLLTLNYLRNQKLGLPIHEWDLSAG
jgi:gamma-glutamyl:cysteine ligase YbdK (ATP-grasp superfamily)